MNAPAAITVTPIFAGDPELVWLTHEHEPLRPSTV